MTFFKINFKVLQMPISVCYFDLVSDRTVNLRTPKETSVGKVVESCLRMLGINEDKDHFNLKSTEGFVYKKQKGIKYLCAYVFVSCKIEYLYITYSKADYKIMMDICLACPLVCSLG